MKIFQWVSKAPETMVAEKGLRKQLIGEKQMIDSSMSKYLKLYFKWSINYSQGKVTGTTPPYFEANLYLQTSFFLDINLFLTAITFIKALHGGM